MNLSTTLRLALALAVLAGGGARAQERAQPASTGATWYKGNLHTHSLWSDGDDYPEMIADWYKKNGYDFLSMSDHNALHEGERWLELKPPVSIGGEVIQRGGGPVLARYINRFGRNWVEQREEEGKRLVRLKPLAEYRSLFEEPGRYLLIPSEEISATWKKVKSEQSVEQSGPVHFNVTNIRDFIAPVEGDNAVTIMQRTLDAVQEQRERTGQSMVAHLNHPNFRWGITAEEMMQVRGVRFFEVYNGHPGSNNQGDATRASMDRMWDIILTQRLAGAESEILFGVAVDDSHHYHSKGIGRSNSGRGWIMVRAQYLTAETIVRAMEAGDFYATSGVSLIDVTRGPERVSIRIKPEVGVTYVTQFIGTRRGYDPESQVMESAADSRTLPHRRYSTDIGEVLAEVSGTEPSYSKRGDELYVRAKIVSSKPKTNASVEGEFETAWIQPVVWR